MKRYFLIVTILIFGLAVNAQSVTTSFDVDGIQVIYKPTQKNLINLRLYFRGGVADYPSNKAGLEAFAIEATTQCGTKKYTGNDFKDIADKYSILIGGSSTEDYGYIQLNCLDRFFNNGWDLFTEAVMNPVFNESDVEILRNKLIARAKGMESSPDDRLEELIMKNGFEGTAYETNPDGTEQTLAALTASDLKNYYNTILNKNRIFLVVVGKIDKEELIKKIHSSFATMPSVPYTPVVYQMPAFNDNRLVIENREMSTNYMGAIMNAPKFSNPDYVPFRLGIGILGGALFRELRNNRHLSYSQGAFVRPLQMPYAEMFISTTNPKDAAPQMLYVLRRLKEIVLSDRGLEETKNSFITSYYMKEQSASAITSSLGLAEILGGWQLEDNLPNMVNDVTPLDIRKALNKYIYGVRWSYLGNKKAADDANNALTTPLSN